MNKLVLTGLLMAFFVSFSLAVYSVDVIQDNHDGLVPYNINPNNYVVQEFKPNVKDLNQIAIWVSVDNPTGLDYDFDARVEIKNQLGSIICSGVFNPTSEEFYGVSPKEEFVGLSSGCDNLDTTQFYELVVRANSEPSNGAILYIHASDSDVYEGDFIYHNGAELHPPEDLYFKTFYEYIPDMLGPYDANYFHDLTFSWETISKAKNYRVNIQYLGGHDQNSSWPGTYSEFNQPTRTISHIEPTVSTSVPISRFQLHKQPPGMYSWNISACIGSSASNCVWYDNPNWFYTPVSYAPKITSTDGIEAVAGTQLTWEGVMTPYDSTINFANTFKAASQIPPGVGSLYEETFLVIRLEGLTPGTKCYQQTTNNTSCYIALSLTNGLYSDSGHAYFEFGSSHFTVGNKNYIEPGTYEWALSVFQAKNFHLNDIVPNTGGQRYYKNKIVPKLKFNKPSTFIISSGAPSPIKREPQAVKAKGTPNGGFGLP